MRTEPIITCDKCGSVIKSGGLHAEDNRAAPTFFRTRRLDICQRCLRIIFDWVDMGVSENPEAILLNEDIGQKVADSFVVIH